MKILIDPVYTGKVHKCSTSFLAWEIVEELSKWRDDCFFYILYPKAAEASDEEMEFLQQHKDRVKLLPYPYIQADRVEEIFKLHDDMIHYLSPGDSDTWDYDVVISSRIQQLPFMRNVSGREAVNYPHGTHRLFIGLEEMPMFSFRKTVAWAGGGNMNLQSMSSYLSAGAVVVNNLWTKTLAVKLAREYLAPSQVIELSKNIHEVVPVKLQRLTIGKTKPVKDTFNVVFTGRMTNTRNFQDVVKVFRQHFSYPLNKGDKPIRFIVSTNSSSTGTIDPGEMDFIEVQMNNRDQFHKLLREEAHVVVNLSEVEDFSMSTYEPLMFGIPVITMNVPWTSFLGKDYPFRSDNHLAAYVRVKEFAVNYEEEMDKFRHWEATTWADFVASDRNVSTSERLIQLIGDHEKALRKRTEDSDGRESFKSIVAHIDTMDLPDGLVDARKVANELGWFLTNAKQWRGIPIGKRPVPYLLKIYLELAGYTDTREPGIMRRLPK